MRYLVGLMQVLCACSSAKAQVVKNTEVGLIFWLRYMSCICGTTSEIVAVYIDLIHNFFQKAWKCRHVNGLRKHPSWEVQQLVLFSNLKKIWVDWVAAEIMVGTSLELCIFFIKYNVYFNPGIIPIRISISRINLLCVCCPVNIEVIYYISS